VADWTEYSGITVFRNGDDVRPDIGSNVIDGASSEFEDTCTRDEVAH
jgi:hypothetical protein